MRIQKREKLDKQGNVIEFRNSTLTPDAAGRWQLNEVREGNVKDGQGGEKTKEERVLRPDSDGKLALVGRTISREAQTSSGEKRETVEKFSRNVPGTAPDANTLHLEERATKVSKSSSDAGSQTLQEVERRNPGLPGDNLSVSERSIDTVRPGMAGTTSETRTIQVVGPASSLNTVWVDTATGKSSTVQVDTKATPQGSQKPQ
jgi:hypothetical protein